MSIREVIYWTQANGFTLKGGAKEEEEEEEEELEEGEVREESNETTTATAHSHATYQLLMPLLLFSY